MRFAATFRNRGSERVVALISMLAVFLSMMVMFATPVFAHHAYINGSSSCDPQTGVSSLSLTATSWTQAAAERGNNDEVVIEMTLDGGSTWVEVGTGAFNEGNGRQFILTFSGSQSVGGSALETLEGSSPTFRTLIEPNTWYSNDDPTLAGGSGNGDAGTTVTVAISDCDAPQDRGATVTVSQECRVEPTLGPVAEVVFNVVDPDSVVESITIVVPGGSTIEVDASDGWLVDLYRGDYTWSVNFVNGYQGDPIDGSFIAEDDCLSCPIPGAIDLSGTQRLGSYNSTNFATWGGPVSDVDIPAGYYNITLASYDRHSEKSSQDQHFEIWALADGPNGGTWTSPLTPDLSESTNFEIYTNVGGGPVFVPAIEDLYTIHGHLGRGDTANSLQPVCAKFDPVPPEPPSGWACLEGDAVFIPDATNFEGDLYDSREAALEDPGCQDEVLASTTFTIGGACALNDEVTSFTISGRLGEGLTLSVDGQTISTSPFTIDVGAAGSYPYSVTLDEGFELAQGSPAPVGVILIQDCAGDVEVDDVDELPLTGIGTGALSVASIALIGAGTLLLMSSKRREES